MEATIISNLQMRSLRQKGRLEEKVSGRGAEAALSVSEETFLSMHSHEDTNLVSEPHH